MESSSKEHVQAAKMCIQDDARDTVDETGVLVGENHTPCEARHGELLDLNATSFTRVFRNSHKS
jgi:hypothetical protein